MKAIRTMIVLVAFLGATIMSNAQKVVTVYPKRGVVVTKIQKPKRVLYKGVNFHYAQGVWYKKHTKGYVVCAAPFGATIKRLPRGYRVVRRNGRKLYQYKGIWYKKRKGAYVVVNV